MYTYSHLQREYPCISILQNPIPVAAIHPSASLLFGEGHGLPTCNGLAKDRPTWGIQWKNTGKHMEIQWKNMKIQWKNMETQWRNKCFEHDLNGMLWKLSSNQCCPPAPFFPNPENPQTPVVQWRIRTKKQHRPRGSSIFREKKWFPTSSNPHSKVYVSDDGDDTGSIFGFPV